MSHKVELRHSRYSERWWWGECSCGRWSTGYFPKESMEAKALAHEEDGAPDLWRWNEATHGPFSFAAWYKLNGWDWDAAEQQK